MASPQMQAFLDAMRDAPPKKQETPSAENRKGLDDYMSGQPVADGFTWEDVVMAACPARRFLPASGTAERAILYLHGGGYYTGSPDSHHALMSHLCVACDALVVGLAYRLAPEHPYPAALNDAIGAYRELTAEIPAEKIMIAGDSAGGGLTLACLHTLRDTSGAMPGCATLISPNVDLSATGAYPNLPQSKNYYAGSYPQDHPGISPVFNKMHGLPPILIQMASDEAFVDEANRLVNKLQAAAVELELQTFEDAFHVFQMWTEMPESIAAINRIAKFFQTQMKT